MSKIIKRELSITLWLSRALAKKLQAEADRQDLSRHRLILRILTEWLKQNSLEQQGQPAA